MFILKGVKVVCFDTLFEVFNLKDLECTKIVQNESILRVLVAKDFAAKAGAEEQSREGTCRTVGRSERPGDASGMQAGHLKVERLRGSNDRRKPKKESRGSSWSAEFKGHSSTRVNTCQG